MRFAVVTFGCRVNQAESLAIESRLRAAGAEAVSPDAADLVIVNSCSVTASADQGTRQAIRRIARDNQSARIVATGCYATRRPDEVEQLPGVVAVVPNASKDDLLAFLPLQQLRGAHRDATTAERYAGGEGPCGAPDHAPDGGGAPAAIFPGMAGRTAFTLRVQTGCDEPCSYCIIPATRGRSRSTALEDLVRDVRRIEAAGFNEITLTGVHIGAYGRDLTPTRSLGQLVGALLDATTHAVFRIGSLEPMDCTPDLIERASAGRLAPAFHLPLQHASDRMLQRMRRPYGCADYDVLVRAIRRRLPHASIGSDVIVGFPGETDADADRLVEYLADSPLTGLHVFPYSDRPGTAAAALHPKVHGSAVRARGERVREVGRRLAAAFLESLRGTSHRALTIHDGESAVCANGVRIRLDRPQPRNTWVQVTLSVSSDGAVGHVTGPVEVAS